jgi:hypothetical protein
MTNILYIKIGGGKRKPQLQSRNKSSTRSIQHTPQKVKKKIERSKEDTYHTLQKPPREEEKISYTKNVKEAIASL